jgi:murein DD-endopeptidase MepM/ murein hydrolase activator NlpD
MAKIKLVRGLFQGDGCLTQLFGNKLIINGVDIYCQYGLLGHDGIDYGIPTGRELYSCIDGVVTAACRDPANNYTGGYGIYVKIENAECGVVNAHMKTLNVKAGDTVKAGHLLGLSNNTGNSTGPHLHFGVHPVPRNRNNGYNGYINPLDTALVEWVDSLEEILPNRVIKSSKDSIKVTDTAYIQVEELEEIVTKSLLDAIVDFIIRLWNAIKCSINIK